MLFLNFSLCTEIRRQPLCEIFHLLESVLVMMFGQFSNRESLRDLIVALEAHQGKRYHLWWGVIYFSSIIKKVCEKRATNILDISGGKYAFDPTTIPLCLVTFPWAKFRKKNILSKELFDGP